MRLCSLAVCVSLLLGTSAEAQGRKSRREGWHNDYDVAKKLAQKTGKPLFVVFRCEP
jgi:hypothetical protein